MGTKRKTLRTLIHMDDESGIAFILVLGTVSLFAVLVTMQILTAKVSAVSSKVSTERSRAKFAAESATAFAQWMIVNYNFNNPTQSVPDDLENEDEEKWWADGQEHTLEMVDGVVAKVKIFDVNRGWDINQLNRQRSNILNRQPEENEELQEQLEEFFAVYDDYIDRDDLHRHPTFGMERDDYESEEGLENFPRNGKMEFREEMYWIKKVDALVPRLNDLKLETALPDTLFQVLPPQGIRQPRNSQRNSTSFWSAPMHWLEAKIVGELTGNEQQLITECREEGFVDELTIQDCLGFDLHAKLRNIGLTFNPRDTSVFTIDVSSFSPDGEITRRLVSTLNLKNLPTQSGTSDVMSVTPIVYWQKIFY